MVTYNVDIWLPDASELGYPELGETSRKVRVSLDSALKDVQEGNIEIHFEDKVYKRDDKDLNISNSSVAAISFSEDFAKKWSAKNGNVAVLAMMGGELPSQKNFFRLGFSVETIAAILGDRVINDRQVSHVLLIRVKNELGEKFEEEFKRKLEVPSQNCSLDILEIGANVTKDTKGIQSEKTENNGDGNTPTTTHTEFVTEKGGQLKVKSIIGQWLSKCIYRKEGLRSVVIYGYWDGYWDFVKEVLRCKDFNREVDWLYVESNYPLHAPFLYNVRTEGPDKQNVRTEGTDKEIDGGKQMDLFEGHIRLEQEKMKDLKVSEKVYTKETKGINKRVAGEDQEVLTEDELGRVRCFTGELVEKESSFNTFAKETVHLLWDAIMVVHDQLSNSESQGLRIQLMRKGVCEFLRDCHFYKSEHLGSFFFRKDGELFFPLHHYNGNLVKQGIVRECCCKSEELTKEAVADQLRQLSDSLNKITGATTIPRNFEIEKTEDVVGVFKKFSETIAKISNGIKIDFVSNYPGTKRVFYTWPQKRDDASKGDDTKSFCHVSIFDDACKKVKGAIQINLKDSDLEDNNAFRVYVVCRRTNCFAVSTLTEWGNKQNRNERNDAKAIVFAKSRIRIPDGASEKKVCKILANYVHCQSSMAVDEFLRDFLMYRQKINEANPSANFLYYIPEYISEDNSRFTINGADGGRGGIFMTTRYKLSLFDLQIIENMVSRIFSALKTCIAEHDALRSSIKSAIGSIMSRNGSHNIGSHVLAALSHNVGTMPDDRVLYQYIQHRMDYIATATTEFPTWRQPMLFVSSVMKQFMMQKHLLNFISRSEGLQAYQFQNPALTASTQPNTIRLHVRRIHDEIKDWEGRGKYSESEYDNFIPYGNEKAGSFERDILVAIPGGVIGQHAFYTIIENILRNAAKHEWATTESKNVHLDVYIDFHDNPNDGVVEFQVWNDRVNKNKETSDDRNISSLVKTLAERMSASFIDNEGGLRKENWGLAEMRISAGFLRGSDVSLVGGIGVGQKEMLGLIRPLVVGNGEEKECLGYRFDLHKPKELLVVLPNKYCEGKEAKFTADKILSLNKMLSQYGVNVMSESEAGKSKGLAYSYVLFDNFDGKVQGRYNLPFRVLSAADAINLSNEGRKVRIVAKFNGDFIKDVRNELEHLPEHDQGDIRTFAHKILEQIYSSWIVHVRSQRSDIGKDPALVIDIKDDGGGGKSLFANANLLYFIFESSFNSAVRSYLAMHTPESLTPSLAGALFAFTELSPRPQFSAKELAEEVDDDADVGNMILAQLVKWADLAKEDMRVCKGYTTEGSDSMLLPLQDEWNGAEIWQKEFAKWSPRVGIELLLNGLLGYDSDACAKMHDFINYLSGPILEQARAYLAKYEERYATLPEGFGIQNGADKNDDAKLELGIDNSDQSISFTSDDVEKSKLKKQAFCYWRHGDKDVSNNNACNKINEKATYLEPLSGAQSYLNAFRELCSNLCYIKNGKDQVIHDAQLAIKRNNAIRFITELVENSVMRVLIIDERTKKFADEHPDVAAIFASTGISVLGGGEEVVAGIFRSFRVNPKTANNKEFTKKIKGIPIRDFEILIVHQGIIDKQLHGSGKEAKIKVFYEWLKKYMRYVVITTGRGTPPNVPSDARVLPFSVIENTLFKRYPEKMLLVDTVMNMLPIGERGA